jgi:hypothetical protein
MQQFGSALWRWLMDGPIHTTFSQSQGVAMGQNRPLRLRLDVQDSRLIALPWEIMQPQTGKGAVSVSSQILFSRTSHDVDTLPSPRVTGRLNVLQVLGDDQTLGLATEARLLQALPDISSDSAPYHIEILRQPNRGDLLAALDSGKYNIFLYGGHGIKAPDGGRLCLRAGDFLSGTELAQALVRNHITLAVFNACWGAQLDRTTNSNTGSVEVIPRSSLAEVLIHHGVPAVLGMRHEIADEEALHFIQRLMQELRERHPIDQAVATARQHLLSLYGFNQPSWTLPVLYMHPNFNGRVLQDSESRTELPTYLPFANPFPRAEIRSRAANSLIWPIEGGILRVGRREDNDLVLTDSWVSQQHAEIICRTVEDQEQPRYFLKDFSRFGTHVFQDNQSKCVHHREMPLNSGALLRFGNDHGQPLEFIVY